LRQQLRQQSAGAREQPILNARLIRPGLDMDSDLRHGI